MERTALRVTVLHSVNTPDGHICVDIFKRDDGTFGFEEYRRDVEDGRGWFAIGHHRGYIYETEEGAITAAVEAVGWFGGVT